MPTCPSGTRPSSCSTSWDSGPIRPPSTTAGGPTGCRASARRSGWSARRSPSPSSRWRAVARSPSPAARSEIAAGRLEAGTVAGQRMRVTGMRGGRPLLSFVATWFCTSELEPEWDLRPTGWRISVVGDAPLDVEMRFAVPLERMGEWTPGYTANRAVNAVPFVCQAAPGIRTTVDLPQIIGTLGRATRRSTRSGEPGKATEAAAGADAGHRMVLDLRSRRPSPHPAVHGVLLPRPSACAHLSCVPEPSLAADGRLRSGRRSSATR